MANAENPKVNKKKSSFNIEVMAIVVLVILIAGYIVYECYSAIHVPLETQTAVTATVYEKIDVKALAVRDEHVIENGGSAVTVQSVEDGEKVAKNGKIAMRFASSKDAENYSQRMILEKELAHYVDLEKKSTGTATDVQAIDGEILDDVNTYIRNLASGDLGALASASSEMNDTFTRRQLIIGKKIDFSSMKADVKSQIDSLDSNCRPTDYVTTDESGIFSGYTDGCESSFDYKNIEDISAEKLSSYIKKAEASKSADSALGKIITSYSWYFCCVVPSEKVRSIENGDILEVAIKDSDRVLECTVVNGAEPDMGVKETVLVLQCADMDSEITSYRLEDIEIRYDAHTGIKVPIDAVHINDGEKGVYALVSGQVKFRQASVIFTTKDYALLEYNSENEKGIRLYDEIITEGKDLYNGKVFA